MNSKILASLVGIVAVGVVSTVAGDIGALEKAVGSKVVEAFVSLDSSVVEYDGAKLIEYKGKVKPEINSPVGDGIYAIDITKNATIVVKTKGDVAVLVSADFPLAFNRKMSQKTKDSMAELCHMLEIPVDKHMPLYGGEAKEELVAIYTTQVLGNDNIIDQHKDEGAGLCQPVGVCPSKLDAGPCSFSNTFTPVKSSGF